ncbi:MAG TPA: hypothetical protein VM938_09530 [Acidimicrobiales bacterium]|nr:hypothetical protein [Acidimicrobiales bacterium]
MQTITVTSELEASPGRVWEAVQSPVTFVYVVRGLFGVPLLAGRSDKVQPGESGKGWLFLFHVVPFSRHTINIVEIDHDTMTMRTNEHGGMIRAWNHTLHVEPLGAGRSRYSDTVEIDAGALTPVVCRVATGIYRYRHRRWRKLVRKHLQS